MDALERNLSGFRRRLALWTLVRGAALCAVGALVTSALLVFLGSRLEIVPSAWGTLSAVLYGALALLILAAIGWPLLRLSRRRAARVLEARTPSLGGRIETYLDRSAPDQPQSPLLPLLAEDARAVLERHPPSQALPGSRIAALGSLALAGLGAAAWLALWGPQQWQPGVSRLWTFGIGAPDPAWVVEPGDQRLVSGADLVVHARAVGFEPTRASLRAWFGDGLEAVSMEPAPGGGFAFRFEGLREPFEYAVQAAGVESQRFRVELLRLPEIERSALRVRFPRWSRREPLELEPAGPVEALLGSELEIEVEADAALGSAVVVVNGQEVPLETEGLRGQASFALSAEGTYFVAALREGRRFPLTPEYPLRELVDVEPAVRLVFPGRDRSASPIEEVTTRIEARDDFHLESVHLEYSVNGGAWQRQALRASGGPEVALEHVIELESLEAPANVPTPPALDRGFRPGDEPELRLGSEESGLGGGAVGLTPGDVIAYYAVVSDHESTVQSDMFFIEVQPFERRFQQSQQPGGQQGGGGGGEASADDISARQRQILVSTWNLVREGDPDQRLTDEALLERAQLLERLERTLRDQTTTLVERARARALGSADSDVATYIRGFEQAADAMAEAADELSELDLEGALGPEQRALGLLLRAEASLRDVQVARQQQGGGGGGGGARRQLSELFELEMDPAVNRYETPSSASSSAPGEQSREQQEAFDRLEQLARRQEQLARELEGRTTPPTLAERWQQERLRRELEQLRRDLARVQPPQSSSPGQESAQASGDPQAQGQPQGGSQPQSQQSAQGQTRPQGGALSNRLSEATRALEDASQALERASRGAEAAPDAARRAQEAGEALRDLARSLSQERREQERASLQDLARDAERIGARQRESARALESSVARSLQDQNDGTGSFRIRQTPADQLELAEQKQELREDLERLEREGTELASGLDASDPESAQALREAFRDMRQSEIAERLSFAQELIREGSAPFALAGEDFVTRELEELAERLQVAAQSAGSGDAPGSGEEERARDLAGELSALREQLEAAAPQAAGAQGQGQGQGRGEGQTPGQGTGEGQPSGAERERLLDQVARRARQLGEQLAGAGVGAGVRNQLRDAVLSGGSGGRDLAQRELALRISLEDAELALRERAERAEGDGALRPAVERVPQDAERPAVADYYRSLSAGDSN